MTISLSAPDLLNSLTAVLMRFREQRVAIAADIEAMFHQCLVIEEDQPALSFLWRELQSWPELLGHKGNKPVKMTYFLPPPPPDAMLMSGIQVIFGRLNVAWGEGGTKEMVY